MKKQTLIYLCLFCIFMFFTPACDKESKDVSYPVIIDDGFLPADCAEFMPGGVIQVAFKCTDDVELGNFNIEIHSNFDHHTHGTSSVECDEHQHDGQEEEQHQHQHSDAGWVFNKDYEIPAGLKEYQGSLQINIPADAEEGEYHFMLRLTDHAGWQTIKSVPIHIETAI